MRTVRSSRVLMGWMVAATLMPASSLSAQQPKTRDELLVAARRIMESARFAAFVTVDESGQPQSRIVDPFAPDSAMVIWIGTNPRTRKAAQIQKEPRVALTWFDTQSASYVTILGRAQLVNDEVEKQKHFKPEWSAFYPDRARDYLLVRVVPERLELISERDGVGFVDPVTWLPANVKFER